MDLYNTLSRRKQKLEPLAPPIVSIYTCGPTVYDFPHIGNWFTFIRYDLLIRALKVSGYDPDWVINITDVGHLISDADEGEDKLEKGAKREGKTAWEIADFYSKYFLDGLKRLNITKPSHVPRATQHITEQIDFIKKLDENGYTYIIDDGVYYDTSRFRDYAKLAAIDMENLQAGIRVKLNLQKRNSTDFALWKFSPKAGKRDMEWDSPWGKGFPGWHIECSAMVLKYLGQTIDIHAGGIDHIPIHNTNEIAQSQAANGRELAKIWFHANHILIDNEKIAKSAGNGITLDDLEKKGFSLAALRMLVLQSHYRSQSHFSWDILFEASTSLKNIQANFSWIYSTTKDEKNSEPKLNDLLKKYKDRIKSALLNDLDTPSAVAILHEAAAKFSETSANLSNLAEVEAFEKFIETALGVKTLIKLNLSPEQEKMIMERTEARQNEDWAKSDELRDKLASQSIGIRDTTRGTIWFPN